jgi:hypothetical protein
MRIYLAGSQKSANNQGGSANDSSLSSLVTLKAQ